MRASRVQAKASSRPRATERGPPRHETSPAAARAYKLKLPELVPRTEAKP